MADLRALNTALRLGSRVETVPVGAVVRGRSSMSFAAGPIWEGVVEGMFNIPHDQIHIFDGSWRWAVSGWVIIEVVSLPADFSGNPMDLLRVREAEDV